MSREKSIRGPRTRRRDQGDHRSQPSKSAEAARRYLSNHRLLGITNTSSRESERRVNQVRLLG